MPEPHADDVARMRSWLADERALDRLAELIHRSDEREVPALLVIAARERWESAEQSLALIRDVLDLPADASVVTILGAISEARAATERPTPPPADTAADLGRRFAEALIRPAVEAMEKIAKPQP
jgi:hypothetical protein